MDMHEKAKIKELESNDINLTKLRSFLSKVDYNFTIPLSEKIELNEYAKKVLSTGTVLAAIDNNEIIGILSGYLNDKVNKVAYISVLVVDEKRSNEGIGTKLLQTMIKCALYNKMEKVILNTDIENNSAITFYTKNGFAIKKGYIDEKRSSNVRRESDVFMEYKLKKEMTNILLTSVGRRSYLIEYFKEVLGEHGYVHVSNSTSVTPAFNRADFSVTTPLIHDEEYIPFIINYCKENNIQAIISLFDVDLPILSMNKKRFDEAGIKVVVSDQKVIEICNDKIKTFEFLVDNHIKSPATYSNVSNAITEIDSENLSYPVIIKPRWGMGSIGIYVANNKEELKVLYDKTFNSIKQSYLKYESEHALEESIIIQQKLNGQEYGLDVINDLDGNYQTTIVKKKYAMRSGETDAAITEDSDVLKKLGRDISHCLKHIGNLDVDVFMVEGVPYVLEMNARFGGGYPFSHAAGVNLPKAIIKWLNNEEVPQEILKEKIGVLSHKDINIVRIKEENL